MGNTMSAVEPPTSQQQQRWGRMQQQRNITTVSTTTTTTTMLDAPTKAGKIGIASTTDFLLGGVPLTPVITNIALSQLSQAIAILGDKAIARAPKLTELEKYPRLFLSLEQYNPWTSARRLASYWETRNEVFGSRSTLPVLQSRLCGGGGNGGEGEGALTESDMDLFVGGSLVRLSKDGTGRLVVIIDMVAVAAASAQEQDSALRCLFLALSLCAENSTAQEDGVAVLLFVDDDGNSEQQESAAAPLALDSGFALKMKELNQVMPIRIHSVHAVCVFGQEGSASGDCNPISKTLVFGDGAEVCCTSHRCTSMDSLMQEVTMPLGVTETLLPTRLGGVSGVEHLKEMFQATPSAQTQGNASTGGMLFVPSLTQTVRRDSPNKKVALKDDTIKIQPTHGTSEAKTDMESPTSVSRKRKQVDSNTEETSSTGDAGSASSSMPEDEASRQEFIRKRNALYSRRKYHRKKIEIEVLQNQAANLKVQNQEMKSEGVRLEKLLEAARHQVAAAEQEPVAAEPYLNKTKDLNQEAFFTGNADLGFQPSQPQKRPDPFFPTTQQDDPSPQLSAAGASSAGGLDTNILSSLQPGSFPVPMALTHVAGMSQQNTSLSNLLAQQQLQQSSGANNCNRNSPGTTGNPSMLEGMITESGLPSLQQPNLGTVAFQFFNQNSIGQQQQQQQQQQPTAFLEQLLGQRVQGPIPAPLLEILQQQANQGGSAQQGFP